MIQPMQQVGNGGRTGSLQGHSPMLQWFGGMRQHLAEVHWTFISEHHRVAQVGLESTFLVQVQPLHSPSYLEVTYRSVLI